MIRADHPPGNRRGGVCIYYKESLPIKMLNIYYLQECICFDLKIGNKLCTITSLYRSPSETADEFDNFLNNLNLTLESVIQRNPFLTVVIGDFNARSSKWWSHDKTTQEGIRLEKLFSQYALSQVINKPTHFSQNSNSCIDLLFTNQNNLITDSGVHPSLHSNCHHQIIYGKFNLRVFYPPPYERHVWHYEHANVDMISKAIERFDWDNAFLGKNVNEKASILTKTILNIMSNYIPNEIITIDDKDPPWVNNKIKSLIKNKNEYFKNYFNLNNSASVRHLEQMQESLRRNIETSKQKYYSKFSSKLTNKNTNPKCYWSVLKGFLNNKKIPCIPPLIYNNQFITDFKEKSELFNSFFAKQCSLIETGSKLPIQMLGRTNKSLNNITFNDSDILSIISNLDPNKAHGHDQISIRMLQIWAKSICKPLHLIFSSCMESGIFLSEWKMANAVPVYKTDDKQNIKNYRPVSLLPIFGKVFERLIYKEMYSFFIENDLISSNQSGFKQGDSCINQLLSITHEIYQSLDQGYEVRGVFLDISKAFDKVWHKGLLYKLEQNGIKGLLLNILKDFLKSRKQRVVLNGQHSSWSDVLAGVPQGSILGPLLFLIYINDLSDGLNCNPKLFADDTSLFSTVYNINEATNTLNNDLNKITEWAHQWKMSFNPDISKQAHEVVFSRKRSLVFHPSLTFNNIPVAPTSSQKHLGMHLEKKLNFEEHLSKVETKVNTSVGIIRKLQNILPRVALLTVYKSFIRPLLDYGDIKYDKAFNELFHEKLESLQYNAALAITGAIKGSSTKKL